MVYNPQPTYGSGTATGMVPGQITPPDPAADLAAQYPNLSATNSAVSGNILAGLQGNISQPDLNAMQDKAAGAAAASGMPGSNAMPGTLGGNKSARDIGMMQYQVQQNALNNYNKTIPTVSSTQTLSPQLQLEVAGTNALNASAPNPATAQSYAQQLYDQYAAAARGPGGGTRGASGPGAGTMPTTGTGTTGNGMGTGPGQMASPVTADTGNMVNSSTYPGMLATPQNALQDPSMFGNDALLNQLLANPVAGQGTSGYQPTSSGSMYTGDVGGYDASQLVDPYGMDASWY